MFYCQTAHGLPTDLLDRLIIIRTEPYTEDELRLILKTRCEEEDVNMEDVRFYLILRDIIYFIDGVECSHENREWFISSLRDPIDYSCSSPRQTEEEQGENAAQLT